MSKKAVNKPLPKAAPVTQPVNNKPANAAKATNWFSVKYLCIVLAVVSFILYANTLQNGYVLDDKMVLRDNVMVMQGISAVPELLATPHMRGYLIIPNDLYRPLSLVMFAIEYEFFGPNPTVGHLFNILTFIGCVIMLFLFLDKFFGRQKTAIAFIGALVFALHPVHTEVVANIKSRDELLCFFFGFWSLNLFMDYMKSGKMLQLLMGTFTLFLAYISKETVITFLAVIPFLFFFYYNENKKHTFFIMGGMAVATALFLLIRTVVLNKYDANQAGASVDFIDNALANAPSAASKLATEFYVMGKYLWLMFIPHPLLSTYSFNSIPFVGFGDYQALLSIAAYGLLLYVGVSRFMKNKKDPWVFAIIFYLATISLFSNFPFLMGAEMAERFAFFASVGICIAVALAVEKWILKAEATNVMSLKSTKVLMVLVPLLVLFGGMTIARNASWKDEFTLYKTDLEKSPNDSRLYQYLATAMAEDVYPTEPDSNKRKELDVESVRLLKRAIEIYPEFAEAHVELGRVYERMRMYEAAASEAQKALALKPMNTTANNNLGSVYITLGRYREAIPYLLRSVEGNPNFKYVYLNLARCYKQLNILDSAAINYNKMLAFDPGFIEGRKELATVYFNQQKFDSAAVHFRKVAEMTPQDADAYNNVGAVYLNGKKYNEAIPQFLKAISINPKYTNAYSNLGRAYYLSGQYAQAIDALNKELAIDPKNGRNIPYIALSYQKMGRMDEARKYEAIAKQIYSDFKLE